MLRTHRSVSSFTLMFLILGICILGCKQFGPEPKWPKSTKLSDNEDHPQKILSDGAYVYFVTGGTIASKNEQTNNIKRIRIADGSVSVVVAGGNRIPNDALALDNKFLYWSDGANILRVPKEGGQEQVVVANVPQPSDMLVDNDHVYWMIWGGEGSPAFPLMMASINGSDPPRAITPPQAGATGFCITGDSVVWITHEGIKKVPKAGGDVAFVYSNPTRDSPLNGLAQDADNFYFMRGEAHGRTALIKISKAGGEPIEIAPSISQTMEFIADESNVYYFDLEKGYGSFGPVSLRRVSKNGGEPVTLDTGGAGWVQYIAIDDKQVYFTDIARVYAVVK